MQEKIFQKKLNPFHDDASLNRISKNEWKEYVDVIKNQLFVHAQAGNIENFKELVSKYEITIFHRIKQRVRESSINDSDNDLNTDSDENEEEENS